MKTLTINSELCIRCGKCVRICPSRIFVQATAKDSVAIENFESCIACGHCVGVCSEGAICHSSFEAEKVHKIDYAMLPNAEQVMMLMRARRSNRAFSSKAIPASALDMILEAAHRAPTASNAQNVSFTLVTDPEKIAAINDFTIGVFDSLVRKLTNPVVKALVKPFAASLYRYVPIFERMKQQQASGTDLILRGSTAVLFIHTPRGSRFGAADANLAYQNASLMAESLAVAQFYTGFVCTAAKQSGKLAEMLGIQGTIHAGMGLGMPSFRFENYIDKEPINLTRL